MNDQLQKAKWEVNHILILSSMMINAVGCNLDAGTYYFPLLAKMESQHSSIYHAL
jgi:hypothetical protein